MLKFLPLALLTLLFSCSSLPPEVPIPEKSVGITEDGHNVLVYPEGYLNNILTKIDTEGSSNTLIFKDMKPEDIPNVGDIIASPATENAPYGFLYKALGVSTKDGITAVAVRNATLEEAIEDADFESETEFQFDEDGNLLKMLQKSTSANLSLSREIPLGNGKKISTDVSYSTTFNFDINIKKWKIQSTRMTIKQSGKTALKGSIKQKVEKETEKDIGSVKLPNITFLIGLVPVVITNELSFSLNLSGNAEADLTVDYTINGNGEYGFEYSGGRFSKVATSSFNNTFDYEQSISGEMTLGVAAGLESKFYGIVGLGLGAGPALKLSVEGNPIGVYVFENGFKNSEKNGAALDLGLDFSAEITLGMLGFGLSYTFAESWVRIKQLYKSSFLPSFDDPQVSIGGSGVAVKSVIRRDKLNYPVKAFGICIENVKGDCKNGNGERKSLEESVKVGEYRNIDVTFSNIEYEDYSIMPYFDNGMGGVYYDRAVNVVQGVVQSSSSIFGSSSSGNTCTSSMFTDSRDNKSYKSVKIGEQVWMGENLNYNISGSECYDYNESNCDIYGRLYNWSAAMNACPSGWHLPSDAELTKLTNFVGGLPTAGTMLKSTDGWDDNEDGTSGNGTDNYCFAALPGGYGFNGFYAVGYFGCWRSSTNTIVRRMFTSEIVDSYNNNNSVLCSVRCLKD